jgi:hypothetical protein
VSDEPIWHAVGGPEGKDASGRDWYPGLDAAVWRWRLARTDGQMRDVFIGADLTSVAIVEHGGSDLRQETVDVVESEGRSAIDELARRPDPPRRVIFTTVGRIESPR